MPKKKFLLGLSSAVAIVAAGAATSYATDRYEETTGKKFQSENQILSELLMQNDDNAQNNIQLAGHSSHSSHGSHGSHGSHSSHSSGY